MTASDREDAMSFSLDPISTGTLKAEAKALREQRSKAGFPLSHSAALEEVAHAHGYRDWNTAVAALPERIVPPAQVGERVEGSYLGQAFTGTVMGLEMLPDLRHCRVTIQFDKPVDVVRFESFSAFRQRVVATVDARGNSPAKTGDGRPQMELRRLAQ